MHTSSSCGSRTSNQRSFSRFTTLYAGWKIVDYKRATDRLFERFTAEDLAAELGVSQNAIARARLDRYARVSPATGWLGTRCGALNGRASNPATATAGGTGASRLRFSRQNRSRRRRWPWAIQRLINCFAASLINASLSRRQRRRIFCASSSQ
jgi:hypothetical protein